MRLDTEYLEFMWPMRHFLITCGDINEKSNIITVSFCMVVSKKPPLIACAIGKDAFSRKLIKKYREFIINIPPKELKPEIYYCGFNSGDNKDKFQKTGLTPKEARSVKAPIIDECVAFLECKLKESMDVGDKILFIGEVIESYADEDVFMGKTRVEFASGEFPKKIYGDRFL